MKSAIFAAGAAVTWATSAWSQTANGPAPAPAPASTSNPPAPGEALEVTVNAAPIARTPGSAHIIKAKELERFEYDDPLAVLYTVPGVYSRGEDGIGLRPNIGIRGVNSDRSKKITLMEDGVLFAPAPYSAPAAYYFPMITRMNYVRVIKGPGAIAYGPQTVGGALDLLTRPIPSDVAGSLDVSGGEYAYRKFHGTFGSSNERSGFVVEGVHLGNNGFKELPSGSDTGSMRNEWMFKGSYVLDPASASQDQFGLKASYSDEVSNETYLGLTDADFRENPNQRYPASELDRMTNHRTSVVFSYETKPAEGLSIKSDLYRHDFARVWRKVNGFRSASLFDVLSDPTSAQNAIFYGGLSGRADSSSPAEAILIGPNDRRFVSEGLQSVVRWATNSGPVAHRVEAGLRLHYDSVERKHSEDAFVMFGGELYPEGGATRVTAFNGAGSHALALHALDALTFGALTLTPGIRAELIASTATDHATRSEHSAFTSAVLPGAGAYLALTRHLGLLAGVHQGFSPPPPGGETGNEPERSVNYEAGWRFSKAAARAELILFYNDYSNLTDVCTFSSGCTNSDLDQQFDAGEAAIYGLEALATHSVPLGKKLELPLHVAYTLTRAEFLNAFESSDPIFGSVASGDQLPYVPRHQLNASLGLENAAGGLVVGATYVSPLREIAGSAALSQTLATDEQFWVDAGARYKLLRQLSVYVNVRNVFDRQYIVARRPFGARPNAPRWFQIGSKFEF